MVAKSVLVKHLVLSQQTLKLLLSKMSSIITNEDLGVSMAREDYLLEELNYHSRVVGRDNEGLHPHGDIIDYHQDVVVALGR